MRSIGRIWICLLRERNNEKDARMRCAMNIALMFAAFAPRERVKDVAIPLSSARRGRYGVGARRGRYGSGSSAAAVGRLFEYSTHREFKST